MLNKIRTAVVPSVVVVLAAYGMAFAATGSPNPIALVSHHGHNHGVVSPSDTTEPTDSPEASETPESPEPSHTPKVSHGPERSTVGCPDGFTGNHGQFVSQSDDKEAAAKSDCGKPMHSEEPAVSSSPSDNGDHGQSVEHGHEQSPEPSESPDPDTTGDQHSNDHQGNSGDHSTND